MRKTITLSPIPTIIYEQRILKGGAEEIQSSSGSVYNDEDRHSSSNYNSERGENGNGYERNNDHSKPDGNGNGNGHNGDETEP